MGCLIYMKESKARNVSGNTWSLVKLQESTELIVVVCSILSYSCIGKGLNLISVNERIPTNLSFTWPRVPPVPFAMVARSSAQQTHYHESILIWSPVSCFIIGGTYEDCR